MQIAVATEFVSNVKNPPYGGVDARLLSLCHELSKKHDVHVFTSRQPGHEEIENRGRIVIHRIGQSRPQVQRGDFRARMEFGRMCSSEMQKINPDVIECSGFVSYSAGLKARKALKKPVMVTVHEVWQGQWMANMGLVNGSIGNILERYYLKKPFDKYIAVSDFTKTKLIERMGIKPYDISVIKNGVDRELYDSVPAQNKFSSPTIITTCRLVSYKKVDMLIQAVAQLKPKYPDLKLLVVGKGPEEPRLRQLAIDEGVSNNVEFLGKIAEQRDLVRLMKKSHVFSLPSVVEGFGMVVIEAMAAGIPYVASDIPPLREVTQSGVGGRLFRPLDVNHLRVTIEELLEKGPGVDYRIPKLLESYDWKNLAKTYIEEAKLLSDNRSGGGKYRNPSPMMD